MKAFNLFFLFLFFWTVHIDAIPTSNKVSAFLSRNIPIGLPGKKAAQVPASSPASSPASFYSSEPNIPKHAPNNAETQHVLATIENKKKYSKSIQSARETAKKQEGAGWKHGDTEAIVANQRAIHYANHNEVQVNAASTNGKLAISRSESGRNDIYHAVPRK